MSFRSSLLLAALAAIPLCAQTTKVEFVRIEPGEFTMGSPTGMIGEQPVHKVRITRAFELGKYEITQAQWEAVMSSNPCRFKNPGNPVDTVSFADTQEFLKRMNASDPAHHYRLPTEAEWEYAARAGSTGDFPGELDDIAWYFPNAGQQTHPVGQKKPNAWGLYDMHGNVWEWVADWYDPEYYAASPEADPPGPAQGTNKTLRGGSWGANLAYTRSSVRIAFVPEQKNSYFGFRIARDIRTAAPARKAPAKKTSR